MAVQIVLNQSGAPAGVAGRAREDLVTGVSVLAAAVGGPYSEYRWSFIDRPPNIATGTPSNAAFSAPTGSSTSITPIDQPGTYLVELAVNSGQGLGATQDDIARMTFYAGIPGDPVFGPLNANPALLPRRMPAFGERREHNVPDALQPAGNTTGWAREWLRWWAYIRSLAGGGAGVPDWASYTPTFTVGGSAGATLGNGTITGRYRVVGNECEVENLVTWGSTSSFGAASVPTFIVTVPPGLTPDPTVMLQSFPSFGIGMMWVTGIVGGFVSDGVNFYSSVGDFGPPFGLVVAIGIPNSFKTLVTTGDVLFLRTTFSVL